MRFKKLAFAVAAMSIVAAQPALADTRSAGAVPQRGVSEAQMTIARSASKAEGEQFVGIPFWTILLVLGGLGLSIAVLSDSPN